MIRTKLRDRYISGTVVFQSHGDNAVMSYVGKPNLPLNAEYEFEGKKWKVIQVRQSDYNAQVINVDLINISD